MFQSECLAGPPGQKKTRRRIRPATGARILTSWGSPHGESPPPPGGCLVTGEGDLGRSFNMFVRSYHSAFPCSGFVFLSLGFQEQNNMLCHACRDVTYRVSPMSMGYSRGCPGCPVDGAGGRQPGQAHRRFRWSAPGWRSDACARSPCLAARRMMDRTGPAGRAPGGFPACP